MELKLPEVVAVALARAVLGVAHNQNRVVLGEPSLKWVELSALRDAGGFSVAANDFGLGFIVRARATASLYGIPLGLGGVTNWTDIKWSGVGGGASSSGKSGQECDGEEKSEAHDGIGWNWGSVRRSVNGMAGGPKPRVEVPFYTIFRGKESGT